VILKGNQRGSGQDLALHLLNVADNEHFTLHELRGFLADDLIGAFQEAEAVSLGTKCQQYLFSLSLNPPPNADVPVEDFEAAIDKIEAKLGLAGQPRAVVFHEKKGRRHAHCVWSRIDVDAMRGINLPHYKLRLQDVSRELYLTHDWDMPPGLIDRRERDPLGYSQVEAAQARSAKQDPKALKAWFQACWAQSDSAASLSAALGENGFALAQGDRRGFVAVDRDGKVYSLSRWIGVKARDLTARLGERNALPTVEAAAAQLHSAPETEPSADVKRREADLIARQRDERRQLAEDQETRRLAELQDRQARFPKGLKAVWLRLSGGHERILREMIREADACAGRDCQEMQALVTRHLNERRRLEREIAQDVGQPDLLAELDRAFAVPLPSDPRQHLVLPPDEEALAAAEVLRRPDLILERLSHKKSVFGASDIFDVLKAAGLDQDTCASLFERLKQSGELVPVSSDVAPLYTTRDYQRHEVALLAAARTMTDNPAFPVAATHVEKTIKDTIIALRKSVGAELSEEQKTAIRHLLGPDQLSLVVGLAGAGKSTLLAAAREAWEAQGYRVHGASLSGKAADGLFEASGIASRTLASLEASWKSGYEPVGHGDIVVIDEAGMVGMRQLSRISTELRRRGCKLVLVGDPDQLQPIEAGRPFAISSISSVQPDLRKSADNRRIGSAKHRGTWLPAS
jgi:hypothetical protein